MFISVSTLFFLLSYFELKETSILVMKNRVVNKKTDRQKQLEKMLSVKNVRVGKVYRSKKYVSKNNK